MLTEILLSELSHIPSDVGSVALIHEAALASWGIDNNAVPYAIDMLAEDCSSLHGRFGWMRIPRDEDIVFECDHSECPIRVWETLNGQALSEYPVLSNETVEMPCLEPHAILETLVFSPDIQLLTEQRAALAMVLYADEMSDEELLEFSTYVRI